MLLVIDNFSDSLPIITTDFVLSGKKYIVQSIIDGEYLTFTTFVKTEKLET